MPAATTDRSSSASISADGRTDIFVPDRQTHATVRSSLRSDGTETGVAPGSLNAALSADGQVVASRLGGGAGG